MKVGCWARGGDCMQGAGVGDGPGMGRGCLCWGFAARFERIARRHGGWTVGGGGSSALLQAYGSELQTAWQRQCWWRRWQARWLRSLRLYVDCSWADTCSPTHIGPHVHHRGVARTQRERLAAALHQPTGGRGCRPVWGGVVHTSQALCRASQQAWLWLHGTPGLT